MPEKLSMHQEFIHKLNTILDLNLENEKFGVSELATEIGLSRSQLHRKLQDINGKSSSQFIREYRLEKAMERLRRNEATASEIAYRVGFSSPTYFNTSFHNFYGYPPGEVKFQRSIAPPKKTYSKKLMGFIPVIILVGLIVFNKAFNKKDDVTEGSIEKTIAVLPFVNDSNNEENMYFCNGIMAGIRDHLSKIPEFYVVSRRSVEPYRGTSAPLKIIAKELDVNYVIEGHVQRIGDRAIISAELINVNDNKVLWSERYDEDVSEIFTVQANVIKSITSNLETIITPKLQAELITKPTQDKQAYEYYLKGEEYRFKANKSLQENSDWLNLLKKSRSSYEMAIKHDSLYAPAYLGLAKTVYEKNISYVLDENNLDEFLTLINKALELNPNSDLAYLMRGVYYEIINQNDKAIKDYEKSSEIIPNNTRSSVLFSLVTLYKDQNKYKEAVIALKKLEKIAISRGDLIQLYENYILFYRVLEQENMVDFYFNKLFELHTKPVFSMGRFWAYIQFNRLDEALSYVEKNLHKDNQQRNGLLGYYYFRKKEYPKALEYYKKCYDQVEVEGINSLASSSVYAGYGQTLIHMGEITEGNNMIKKQISLNNELLTSKRILTKPMIYLHNIQLHAILGQYEDVYDGIKEFEAINGWMFWEWMVTWVKNDPEYEILINNNVFNASLKRGEKQFENVKNQIRDYFPLTPPTKTD